MLNWKILTHILVSLFQQFSNDRAMVVNLFFIKRLGNKLTWPDLELSPTERTQFVYSRSPDSFPEFVSLDLREEFQMKIYLVYSLHTF